MLELNEFILRHRAEFFGYQVPRDFALEERHPQLFPTNVRPETLQRDAKLRRQAAAGAMPTAQFCALPRRCEPPIPRTIASMPAGFPLRRRKWPVKPKQAIIVMPQWNADAFSHNALCAIFNRFGVSALRLSKPYHDIRRPAELERADYAVSANVGRTIASCRQAVDRHPLLHRLAPAAGLRAVRHSGDSLGSAYGFLAAAMDSRLRVGAFNHASMSFGDVVWTGKVPGTSAPHLRISP